MCVVKCMKWTTGVSSWPSGWKTNWCKSWSDQAHGCGQRVGPGAVHCYCFMDKSFFFDSYYSTSCHFILPFCLCPFYLCSCLLLFCSFYSFLSSFFVFVIFSFFLSSYSSFLSLTFYLSYCLLLLLHSANPLFSRVFKKKNVYWQNHRVSQGLNPCFYDQNFSFSCTVLWHTHTGAHFIRCFVLSSIFSSWFLL